MLPVCSPHLSQDVHLVVAKNSGICHHDAKVFRKKNSYHFYIFWASQQPLLSFIQTFQAITLFDLILISYFKKP